MNVLCTPNIEKTEETKDDEKAGGEMGHQDSHQIPYRVVAEYEVISQYLHLYVLLIISLTRVMRKDTILQLHLSVTRPASTLLLIPLLVLMT